MKPGLPRPSDSELVRGLRSSSVFGSLSEPTLGDIAHRLECGTLEAGAVLFSEGEAADTLYIVLTGALEARVPRRQGGEILISTIGPGGIVGEVQILLGGRHRGERENAAVT